VKIVRTSVIAVALVAFASVAQASDPFYVTLLTRGISDAQRGDNFRAAKELRIAAFGLVDDASQYLRAQVYLAHAYEKMSQRAEATAAVEKASLAERISGAYTTTAIDPDTRSAFESLAAKLLRPEQLAMVPAFKGRAKSAAPAPVVAAPPRQTVAPQETPKPAPVVTKAPEPVKPAPMPATTTPRQTEAPKPAPVVTKAPEPVKPPAPQETPKPAPVVTKAPEPAQTAPSRPIATPSTQTQQTSPLVSAARHQPSLSGAGVEAAAQISDAQRMLNEGKILAARQIYLRLAQTEGLPRNTSLDVAKGLNQTSAWRESSATYQKLMPFRSGEELHQFYEAVNRYELGDVNAARDLMTRALPALPVTRETSLYKAKILGTQ